MDWDFGNTHYSIVIPEGNWDAQSLALYINTEIGDPTFMTYDSGRLGYIFNPSLESYGGSTCLYLLGIPETDRYGGVCSASTQPVNFGGPSVIHLLTNHSLFNAPTSSLLCSIPVTQNYGELISYSDQSSKPVLVCAHHLTHMEITLVDQNGEYLETYDDIPYYLEIEIQIVNKPFEKTTTSLREAGDDVRSVDSPHLTRTPVLSGGPLEPGRVAAQPADDDVAVNELDVPEPSLVGNRGARQNP